MRCDAQSWHAGRRQKMLALLLSLFIIGIIAGFLARLIVPGRDPIGF